MTEETKGEKMTVRRVALYLYRLTVLALAAVASVAAVTLWVRLLVEVIVWTWRFGR